jgi:hypothetical protein
MESLLGIQTYLQVTQPVLTLDVLSRDLFGAIIGIGVMPRMSAIINLRQKLHSSPRIFKYSFATE